MICPDCDFDEMESEQQGRQGMDIAGVIYPVKPTSTYDKQIVSVRYFCPNCKEYFRWTKGVSGLARA